MNPKLPDDLPIQCVELLEFLDSQGDGKSDGSQFPARLRSGDVLSLCQHYGLIRDYRIVVFDRDDGSADVDTGHLYGLTQDGRSFLVRERLSRRERVGGGRSTGDVLQPAERALAILFSHPEWTVERIAKSVGCSRSALYRSPAFKRARKISRQASSAPPRGRKDGKTGEIEAADDEE